MHWADALAEKVIERNPEKKKYTLAAGISPSGTVHIGNFRDVITADVVMRALHNRGREAKLIFSWDDYDRFRKVPTGVPQEMSLFLDMPLSSVPDPERILESYARHFERPFEETLPKLGITPDYRYQHELYTSGSYNNLVVQAMNHRREIAQILADFKTQGFTSEEKMNFSPLMVYCQACEKSTTKILEYDEKTTTIHYACTCGNERDVNIAQERVGKLQWKVDWPMRWVFEGVDFEAGGADHSTAGGSYDVCSTIVRSVFGKEPPIYQPYEFIGIRGLAGKMSSSSGLNVSPAELLEIYEPELLRWLFIRRHPRKAFDFCFDSEIIRQYDEFDKEIALLPELDDERRRSIELSRISSLSGNSVPFRLITSLGQLTLGNRKELDRILADIGEQYDAASIERRLPLSMTWIKKYAPEMRIEPRTEPNKSYYQQLSPEEQAQVRDFMRALDGSWKPETLNTLMYRIPKIPDGPDAVNKQRQRAFFKNMYQLLINDSTGPRLSTLVMALGREKIHSLLDTLTF